ncbi:unnamed protein product [Rhizophagus irregularis]|uniref:Uncharacterized protein n=1 Tax=Rhizophagus irregularis TaxID=588596 RepID=A0A915ZT39_9GLOM|nr:unnamed protein product [Rhizophagus irregularis]
MRKHEHVLTLERQFNDFTNNYIDNFNEKIMKTVLLNSMKMNTIRIPKLKIQTANNNHNLNNPQLLHLSKKTRAVPSSSDTVDEVQEIEIDLFPDLYNSNSCSNFYREPSLPSSEKLRLAFDTTTMDSTNTGPSSKP